MSKEPYAIWWTTSEEAKTIAAHFDDHLPTWCPEYLQQEWASRLGRNGRGRLWVSDALPDAPRSVQFRDEYDGSSSPLEDHCATCAGIVIRAEDVTRLMHLPGIVTTAAGQLARWEATNVGRSK